MTQGGIDQDRPVLPVILAGGGGTRLWPLSREHYPKQFLSLAGEQSMLQDTLLRAQAPGGAESWLSPLVICNEEHRFLVAEHAAGVEVRPSAILLEPCGRNTAPALTIAALQVADTDPVLLVTPADHLIRDTAAWSRAVSAARTHALTGNLVVFGIRPSHPETGFGYIRTDGEAGPDGAIPVSAFTEKPDLETATGYLADGAYYWNSGIFMMRASVWLAAMARYRPDILDACTDLQDSMIPDDQFVRLGTRFADCPADSIDYAVMEKVCGDQRGPRVVMMSLEAGWSDLGSWSAVFDNAGRDDAGNALAGNVIARDTRNSIIQSHERLVATVGLEDMLVIETADAVLVGRRDMAQEVKHVVAELNRDGRTESISHVRVYRPWGSYESLDNGEHYQVKRLVVNPGRKLSLQRHRRRAEHWVVVSGTATVTRDTETFELEVNQSTYIPLGVVHRLENRQTIPLEVIEVQSGDYLGEDDIERFEDDFGRHRQETGSDET